MKITTRRGRKNDLDVLNKLLAKSKKHWGYDPVFMRVFMENLRLSEDVFGNSTLVLFFVAEELAGFYSFSLGEEDVLELEHFYLHPEFIGKGWGRKLWGFCLKTAQKMGRKEFLIWSDPNANGFYEKMGCDFVRFEKSDMGEGRYQAVFRGHLKSAGKKSL